MSFVSLSSQKLNCRYMCSSSGKYLITWAFHAEHAAFSPAFLSRLTLPNTFTVTLLFVHPGLEIDGYNRIGTSVIKFFSNYSTVSRLPFLFHTPHLYSVLELVWRIFLLIKNSYRAMKYFITVDFYLWLATFPEVTN